MKTVIESQYPITFRKNDATILGNHIRHHHSVSLVGMKRVGISNFLRFFLQHPEIEDTYIDPEHQAQHLFVSIDLNNLVERSPFAFWMVTLKKIVDVIQASQLNQELKETSQRIFDQAIQLGDTFFVLDAVQKVLRHLSNEGFYTTLFLVRFDRLQDICTPEFFANIQAVKDEALQVSFVFTSYRSLHELVPEVFTRSALSVFTQEMYLKPAETSDIEIILTTFLERYDLSLPDWVKQEVLRLSDGHVQYLHLILIHIREHGLPSSAAELTAALTQDEEIGFLSEELWTSLSPEEQHAILTAVTQSMELADLPRYLVETGMVKKQGKKVQLLNPLFAHFLKQTQTTEKHPDHTNKHEFSRKEHELFSLLEAHLGELVEREAIVQTVWKDEAELGVSDWAIDRLIARLRAKLRAQQSQYKILTVITRGYKLVKE